MTYDYVNGWEKQIIFLMIPNEEKEIRHYLAVKILSALLKGTTLKHDGDFYCLNCLHFFRTEDKLKTHEKVCKNKDFCGIVMPSEKDNIQKKPLEMFYEKKAFSKISQNSQENTCTIDSFLKLEALGL